MTGSTCARCFCVTLVMATVPYGAAPAMGQTLTTTTAQAPASVPAQTLTPAASIPTASRAFDGLFHDTVSDFRGLASRETLTALGVGALVAAAVHSVDRPATTALSGSRANFLESGETIGSARFQLGGALAALAVGRVMGNATMTTVGADLVRANLVAQTLTSAVKLSVRRERPDGTQFSFPSGHTSVTFAAATVLQRHFGWKTGVPAYAVASYVAASRVHDKRHFLSDVAFGAAIGVASGWTVTVGHGKTQMDVAPMFTPGGGGIGFTWSGR